MKYKLNAAFELSKNLARLTPEESNDFQSYLSKNGKNLKFQKVVDDMNELQKSPDNAFHHSFVQRPDNDRSFSDFKRNYLEYRLSQNDKPEDAYFDRHVYIQIQLNRRLLASQMAYEEGEIFLAIEQFRSIFLEAAKCELIRIQRESAHRLSKCYRQVGILQDAEKWRITFQQMSQCHEKFVQLASEFNSLSSMQPCCALHQRKITREVMLPFQMFYKKTGLTKVRWMLKYLRAHCKRNESNFINAQQTGIELLRIIRNNPLIFSTQYYLLTYQFMVENMLYMGKNYILRSIISQPESIKRLPIYQMFPLCRLKLHDLLISNKPLEMLDIIKVLEKDITLNNFFNIKQQVAIYKVAAYFIGYNYDRTLAILNRDPLLQNIACIIQRADLKIIELLALLSTNDRSLFIDKLECFRKYVSRNFTGQIKNECQNIYQFLKCYEKGKTGMATDYLHQFNSRNNRIYIMKFDLIENWFSCQDADV